MEEIAPKLKPDVANSIDKLKEHMLAIALRKDKDIKMDYAKITQDRKIKREINDYVLCSHPRIAKGQKRGIAPKYHGPFKIIGINPNGCNYVIKSDTRNSRAKQVHKNNLKFYVKREAHTPMPESQPNNNIITKRTYNKNSTR